MILLSTNLVRQNSRDITNPKFPTVLLLNSRSIIPKLDELSRIMSSICPGFVLVTESWLHSNIHDDLLLQSGYNFSAVIASTAQVEVCVLGSELICCAHRNLSTMLRIQLN